AANGGRSAAGRRAPGAAASRDEADELVHQLATLGKAPAKGSSSRADAGAADGGGRDDDIPATPPKGEVEGDASAEANGDEPINRGMLLKFLSSVRP
ncbi:MAG TPA: hypothetical protein VHM89_02085, partial [Acidimicrobiales bacterium]|nr:hypothetical protein [Acidimicrobiales bacterium]